MAVEENQKNTLGIVKEVKDDVKALIERLDGLGEKLDERYPTRREFKAANWVFGTLITLGGLLIAVLKINQ